MPPPNFAGRAAVAGRLAQSYVKAVVPTAPPSPSVRDASVPSGFQAWAAITVAPRERLSSRPASSYASSTVSTRVGVAPV